MLNNKTKRLFYNLIYLFDSVRSFDINDKRILVKFERLVEEDIVTIDNIIKKILKNHDVKAKRNWLNFGSELQFEFINRKQELKESLKKLDFVSKVKDDKDDMVYMNFGYLSENKLAIHFDKEYKGHTLDALKDYIINHFNVEQIFYKNDFIIVEIKEC